MLIRYSHFLALIMTLLALGGVGAVGYLTYQMYADRNALSELQYSYDESAQQQAYTASVRALLRDIGSDRDELYAVTKGYDPVEVIRVIEDAGRIAHVVVTVNAVTPSTAASQDPTLSSFSINLTTNGSFDRLYQFIALLETLPLPSQIDQFRLEKLDKTWNASMTIRVFSDAENS